MALTSFRQPHPGRPRTPRVEISQAFLECIASSKLRGWQLANLAGWNHYSSLCTFLHQRVIPGDPMTMARFYRLADVINFPRGKVFLQAERRP